MESESRYEDIRCFNIYHSVSLKLQYPFKSQGTNYGAFGSHMTTLLVMQNSIAMTTGLVQTWKKEKKEKRHSLLTNYTGHRKYLTRQQQYLLLFFNLFFLSSTFLRKSV